MPLLWAHARDQRCEPLPAAAVHLDKVICHALTPIPRYQSMAARAAPSSSLASKALWLTSLLDLEDAQRVFARVDDERRPGEPDVGDAVLGFQAGQVVLLDLDTA